MEAVLLFIVICTGIALPGAPYGELPLSHGCCDVLSGKVDARRYETKQCGRNNDIRGEAASGNRRRLKEIISYRFLAILLTKNFRKLHFQGRSEFFGIVPFDCRIAIVFPAGNSIVVTPTTVATYSCVNFFVSRTVLIFDRRWQRPKRGFFIFWPGIFHSFQYIS